MPDLTYKIEVSAQEELLRSNGGHMQRHMPQIDDTDSKHPVGKQKENGRSLNLQVRLQYLRNDPLYENVKPLQIVPGFADTEGRSNVRLVSGPLETLHDVRRSDKAFELDRNGFQYIKAPTRFKSWSSQPKIAEIYLPEMENLLRDRVSDCDEILFYDARIRQECEEGIRVDGLSYNPFARQVHVDNTETSVQMKVRSLTEMKADYLLAGRVRLINIWRPIKHPVYDCGLAVADAASLNETDVIECDRHRKDTGEFWDTMGVVKYRAGFRWHYMSFQDEEDVLLFKNYDSANDRAVNCCLHTAFDVPSELVSPSVPTRESIEVRALIFSYPKVGRRPSVMGLDRPANPHPLAVSLANNQLRRVDCQRSIISRMRTDIDEGGEIKDAELSIRRQEIRRLKQDLEMVREELRRSNSERELFQIERERERTTVINLTRQVENLKEENARLRGEEMRKTR